MEVAGAHCEKMEQSRQWLCAKPDGGAVKLI